MHPLVEQRIGLRALDELVLCSRVLNRLSDDFWMKRVKGWWEWILGTVHVRPGVVFSLLALFNIRSSTEIYLSRR